MPRCYIALGGNIGDVKAAFEAALNRIAENRSLQLVRMSPIYRTQPVGAQSGSEFQNAAVEIETSLAPLSLLDALKGLERLAGRTDTGRWTPRPLDLDLIFYADQVIENDRLIVPHPACWYRRFVLDPLVHLAADVRHPVKGISVAELRNRLLPRPLRMALAGSGPENRRQLARRLAATSAEINVVEWDADVPSQTAPTILAWLGPSEPTEMPGASLEELPLVSRLDASRVSDPATFLEEVLQSALG